MSNAARTPPVPRSRSRRLLSVLLAAAAALLVWVVAVLLLGTELATTQPDGSTRVVGPAAVAVAGVLLPLAGWGGLALLERSAKDPRRTWTVLACAATVLSLAGPVTQAQSGEAAMVLVALHVVVAAVTIPMLAATARTPARRPARRRPQAERV